MSDTDNQPTTVEWSNTGVPISPMFDDIYFSQDDGLAETRYVFLQHNQLTQRWQKLANNDHFTIIETGFGTGLNFLAVWQLWLQEAPKSARLHFVSIERYPLSKAQLQQALTCWPELAELTAELIEYYPHPISGQHTVYLANGKVQLTLLFEDITTALSSLELNQTQCDAWFLDGFAPSKNPAMWAYENLTKVASISSTNTTLATFTAVGRIRRQLAKLGFNITKSKGYGVKREMLCGVFIGQSNKQQRWYSPAKHSLPNKHIAVIGAGLAGSHMAYQLSQQGYLVSVFEQNDDCAQGGSGNNQGVLYTRLSNKRQHLSDFSLSALLYSYRYYQQLFKQDILSTEDGELNGSIQLAFNDKTIALQQKLKQRFGHNQELISWHSANELSQLSSINIERDGVYLNDSGWLNPTAVCHKLLQQDNIQLITQQTISRINRANYWYVNDDDTPFASVVICTAQLANQLVPNYQLPLKTIRGQVSYLPITDNQPSPTLPICHEGYLPPAINQQQCIGATFSLNEADTELRSSDHEINIAQLKKYLPTHAAELHADSDLTQLAGRASVRCTTPDYLPVAGQVVDAKIFTEQYLSLSKNARKTINTSPALEPNLYISTGYGSRGLSYSPLCAAHIVALMNNTVSPLSAELTKATHPGRFIIKNIIQGNTPDYA